MKPVITKFSYNNTESPVYIYGTGAKILIVLHGWGSSIESWKTLLAKIPNQDFTTYFLELPGFGAAKKPMTAWSVDDYANFVSAFIESLKSKPEYLLVHSFGGRIALKLLTAKNNPFSKAIFVGAAGVKPELTRFQKVSKKIAPYFKLVKKSKIFKKPYFLMQKLVYKLMGTGDYLKVTGVMRKTFLNVIEEDLTSYLPKISIPVRLIWGDQDTYTPLWMGNLMHQKIKNSELIVIEDGKHGLHLQNSDVLVQNIIEYFNHS